MSGKTTFMRTIGINIILFRAFGFCHAVRATLPDLQVQTSINRSDDLISSASYFRREAEQLLRFLEINDEPRLFLIDEIYKGTNQAERVGAASAVLTSLAQKNLVMVTTHDVDIVTQLENNFQPFSFLETMNEAGACYDYLIRSGVHVNHNAIRILRAMNYPLEIVLSAERVASKYAVRLS